MPLHRALTSVENTGGELGRNQKSACYDLDATERARSIRRQAKGGRNRWEYLRGQQPISFGGKVLAIRSVSLPADFSDQPIFEHDHRDPTSPEPFDNLRNIGIAPTRCSAGRWQEAH
jgi:hypothetical protein